MSRTPRFTSTTGFWPPCSKLQWGSVFSRAQYRPLPSEESNMPIATKYLFVVSMDVTKEKEALFNEVYDTEHVPLLMKVPGVRAVTRMKTEPATFVLAGERKVLDGGSEPNYVAIYELDSPDV